VSLRRGQLTIAVLAGVALLGATPADAGTKRKPQRKTVKVVDNYFGPTKLTVNLNSTITFKWPSVTGDVHDVALDSGPKGAKFAPSEPAAAQYSFRQKLKKAGLYRVICTFHEDEMVMSIRVRR